MESIQEQGNSQNAQHRRSGRNRVGIQKVTRVYLVVRSSWNTYLYSISLGTVEGSCSCESRHCCRNNNSATIWGRMTSQLNTRKQIAQSSSLLFGNKSATLWVTVSYETSCKHRHTKPASHTERPTERPDLLLGTHFSINQRPLLWFVQIAFYGLLVVLCSIHRIRVKVPVRMWWVGGWRTLRRGF